MPDAVAERADPNADGNVGYDNGRSNAETDDVDVDHRHYLHHHIEWRQPHAKFNTNARTNARTNAKAIPDAAATWLNLVANAECDDGDRRNDVRRNDVVILRLHDDCGRSECDRRFAGADQRQCDV
jgi:hypothetical protein